jgi:hypothetical protein|tara:strand:+ start:22896 stop:23075 length:180 start_codon:yes stop_codon:yes gene_type:complete
MKKYDNFEDFLREKHFNEEPMTLDDDLADGYEVWVSDLDPQELIDYADLYVAEITNKLN